MGKTRAMVVVCVMTEKQQSGTSRVLVIPYGLLWALAT